VGKDGNPKKKIAFPTSQMSGCKKRLRMLAKAGRMASWLDECDIALKQKGNNIQYETNSHLGSLGYLIGTVVGTISATRLPNSEQRHDVFHLCL
jgi:hypothetical protein